jgi:hypothetical protein
MDKNEWQMCPRTLHALPDDLLPFFSPIQQHHERKMQLGWFLSHPYSHGGLYEEQDELGSSGQSL